MLAENMINQVYYCTLHDQVMYTVKIAKLSLFLLKYLYGYSLSPIDSFPRATLLECWELSSLCLGTLQHREDRNIPDKAVLTLNALVVTTNFI